VFAPRVTHPSLGGHADRDHRRWRARHGDRTRPARVGPRDRVRRRASAPEAAGRLGAAASSNAEAAAHADVVTLAVPFAAIDAALAQTGSLDGAVLWSCVNALKPDLSGLAIGFDTSAAEEVARRAPGACVVSAIPPFAEALANGDLAYDGGLAPSVFVCGDDDPGEGGRRAPCP
jgi:predicted dinucleotide-binding enzyme